MMIAVIQAHPSRPTWKSPLGKCSFPPNNPWDVTRFGSTAPGHGIGKGKVRGLRFFKSWFSQEYWQFVPVDGRCKESML